MKKIASLTLASVLLGSLTWQTAFAFSDVDGTQADAVAALQARGIVSGVDQDHFVPQGTITYAQSVQMIVKAMNLNIDNLRFFKQPLASDTYTNIPNDAWYANAFIIAQYNGLDIPKDVNPNAVITREQFGDLLVRALEKNGNFPLVKMFVVIKDEDQITAEYQGALQRLLLYKITQLDQDGKLNPKAALTRGEAANWVHNAMKVLDAHAVKPAPVENVAVQVDKVNEDVDKVTLTRESKPTTGYDIIITGIRFEEGGRAVVTYKLQDPAPDTMNATMMTQPKAVTYVSSAYEVTAELDTDAGK